MPPAQTRVLLAGLPDLLRVIVLDAVGRAGDMRVVGEVGPLDATSADRLTNTDADVLIAGLADERLPDAALRLLYARAADQVAVLAVVLASGDAQLWQLRPHCTRIGDASPDDLVNAVRSARADYAHDGVCP